MAGPTHPTYTHGRYSKLFGQFKMPELQRRYNDAISDPDLLSITQDIALVDVRWSMLLERLTQGESTTHWTRLVKAWTGFQKSNQRIQELLRERQEENDRPDDLRSESRLNRIDEKIAAQRKLASESLNAIGRLITDGAAEQDQWGELLSLTREKVELKRAEAARLADMGNMMQARDAITLTTAVLSVIANEVGDQKTRSRIATGIQRLMGGAVELSEPGGAAEQSTLPPASSGPASSGQSDVIEGQASPALPPSTAFEPLSTSPPPTPPAASG